MLFVRVTPGEKALVERRAGELGLSGSVLVRDALRQFLSNSPAADAAEEAVSSR